MINAIDFIHQLQYDSLPDEVIKYARRCLLDLTAVAAGGSLTPTSDIVTEYVSEEMSGKHPILFSNLTASRTGAAYANGAIIDSFDAHDGQLLCKGHVGAGVYPALLAFLGHPCDTQTNSDLAKEMIVCIVIGYELGSRLGVSLHRTACDYHTSGAWNAIAAAAIGARVLKLSKNETRHALGLAEYHGPRSQMMRCIDYPTMVKDGSDMGAMVGVKSALLAQKGFTGAPAITLENEEVADLFSDLQETWFILDQYFKLYPVCRWAQPAVEAVLALMRSHRIDVDQIQGIEIHSFHEATRLDIKIPQSTEEVQYGMGFPVASALYYGEISARQVINDFTNPAITALIKKIGLYERDKYNQAFPKQRWADVIIICGDGKRLESPPTQTIGDPDSAYSHERIEQKAFTLLSLQLSKEECDRTISHFRELGNT